MSIFEPKPKKATWLLNQTPFEGCLLVFNASHKDFRSKASDFKKKHGIAFEVHSLTGSSRTKAHDKDAISDLYVIIK